MNNTAEPLPIQIFNNLHQDPNTIFKDGEINLKSYILSSGGYSIEVSEAKAVSILISKVSAYYAKELDTLENGSIRIVSALKRELENEKSKYETLKRKLEEEHNRKLEEYQVATEQNKKYKEWYGTLVSPILIIKELWNNGQKGELDILVPPSNWKTGKGLGGEQGAKAKRYWLSMFEEWKIIKLWGRGKYMSNMGMYEALELLNKMMKKQGLIPDNEIIKEIDEK